MRTKTLILTAALGIFGAATSMAQVYSQNAVGFYTLDLLEGFNCVANQLDNGDNNVNTIIPATAPLPDGAGILKWDDSSQSFLNDPNFVGTFFAGYGWVDASFNPSPMTLQAGEGAFVSLPPSTSASIVLVGDVPQGTLTKDLVQGWNLVSQLTPQALGLSAAGNEMPAGDGDTLLFWNSGLQGYILPGRTDPSALTYFEGYGWVDPDFTVVDPTPAIGEAVFYQKNTAGTATWTRDFSVNP